ncbi:MAG: response regulator transcription factor [Bacteroidota bacterium]
MADLLQIRVLIADDHPSIRAGNRAILQPYSQIEIIGESGTIHETETLISELRPHVVLLDIDFPDGKGIHLSKKVVESPLGVEFIILSVHSELEYIRQAMVCGATGYLSKSANGEEMAKAIFSVVEGGTYYGQDIKKILKPFTSDVGAPIPPLITEREQEILFHVARGLKSSEIARELNITQFTADDHRKSLRNKLGARNTAGIIIKGIRLGLLDVKDLP